VKTAADSNSAGFPPEPRARTIILVVSHTYVVALNRKKLTLLAEFPCLDLALAVPLVWTDMGRNILLQRVDEARYAVHPVRNGGHRHLHLSWFAPLELFAVFCKVRPDVVYIEEEPQSLSAWQAVVLAKVFAAKIVLFTWENLPANYRWYRRPAARFILRTIDVLVGGSEEAVAVCRSLGYRGRANVTPQLGLDPDEFAPRASRRLADRLGLAGSFVIGYVARLIPEKGILVLLEAAAQLDFDFRLLIVGDGPARVQARRRAQELGITERVVWTGAVPHERVPDYLNCMDTFVLPSQRTRNEMEQFGHVVIEAMACGVATVGADTGAIPGLIGDAGLVFPAKDALALAGCLRRLHDDAQLRQTLAESGRQRVLKRYTNAVVAGRMYDIIRATVAGLPPGCNG